MRSALTTWFGGILAVACFSAPVLAAEAPALVAAYTQQLVRQCGGELTPNLVAQLVRQVDLNGDKLDDWVVDASRYPCPSRPPALADQGFQVTIFLGRPDGRALPAFQRVGFGARLEGKPETGYSLWLALGGRDCGEDSPKARCDRRVVWRAKEQRFDLAEPGAKPAPTPAKTTPSTPPRK
jgi:hypothetical protein